MSRFVSDVIRRHVSMTRQSSGDGNRVDLEQHRGQGQRGHARQRLGRRAVTPDRADAVDEDPQFLLVVVDDVGAL
jgi:hypothetical protein